MSDIEQKKQKVTLPFKSVAGALWFSVLLGPVGLLYSTVLGGTMMIALCFVAVSIKTYVTATIFWLMSCIWSVAAANQYNKQILNKLLKDG